MLHERIPLIEIIAVNPNEAELLTRFLNPLRDARVNDRDVAADRMIREAVDANPDAVYLLVQRALLMEQALHNAKAQIAQLQQQAAQNRQSPQGGFLGRNNPWAVGGGEAVRAPGAAGYQTPPGAPALGSAGSGSGFLGSIATTAAGVVAGSFLYHGIENLLGHHSAATGLPPAAENVAGDTVINNYYGDDAAETWAAQDDTNTFGDDAFLDSGPDDSSWV